MPNRHPNHTPTTSTQLAGWGQIGGTITATADGVRYVSSSGTGRMLYTDYGPTIIPVNTTPLIPALQVRRNTAGSYMPNSIKLKGGLTDKSVAGYSEAPAGSFITYPRITGVQSSGLQGDTEHYVQMWLYFPDNVAIDITVKNAQVWITGDSGIPATTVIDTGDAGFNVTLTSNSLTGSFKHNAANDEAVETLTWTWGDNTSTINPKTNQASTVTHAYASPGIRTVRLTATNFAGQSTFTEQTVSVPSGTFQAGFSHESNYLSINVDASSSIAPSNAPIDTYAWNWGDGTTTAANASKYASHTYTNPGTYNVTLTIHTASVNRTDTEVKAIAVTAPPQQSLSFVALKKMLEVSFVPSVQNGTNYEWSFGDGSFSSLKEPVHTYATPGNYSVSLAVNSGTLLVVQQVTVSDRYRNWTDLDGALRLEVSVPHAPGTIYNRLPNPSGALGTYGWVTPTPSTYLYADSEQLSYERSGNPSGGQNFYSMNVRVAAGQYISGQVMLLAVDFGRITVEALNAAGTVIGSSTPSAWQTNSTYALARTTPYLLPTGAVAARLKFEHVGNTTTLAPTSSTLRFKLAMLATAATSAALTSNPYLEGQNWQDLLGPTSHIDFTRETLNVGTFSATVLDSIFDPATSGTIRPGQQVRLRAATRDDFDNLHYETLYTGTIRKADTKYDTGPKGTKITLSASDNTTELAQASCYEGVATIAELPYLLEGRNVPFMVNNSGNQVLNASVVAVNENASLLDQIAITRDTSGGYAHIDRNNVLRVVDPQNMPTVPVGVIDESAYLVNGVDSTYSTDLCINSVIIKWLKLIPASGDDEAKVEEVLYGPYEDVSSIEEWGLQPAEFVMQGVENPTTIANKANAILAANSVPQKLINTVVVPIRYEEDIHKGKALLDLYDLISLKYDVSGYSELVRITGIKHTITPKKWLMELSFEPDGLVASPQQVASPPAVASGGSSSGAAVYALARINAHTAVPNNAWTTFTAWTEIEKLGMTYASGVWTVQTAGLYKVHFTVSFANNATGVRGIRPFINGAFDLNVLSNPTTGFQTTMDVSITRRLAVGDTIAVQLYQNSGAALNALGDVNGVYSKADIKREAD